MASKESVRSLLDRYVSAMNRRDRAGWVACFAEDAQQEDPVGTPPNIGHDAIGRFFDETTQLSFTVSIENEPIVVGNEVIAFLGAVAEMDGQQMRLPRIVDHIVLTSDETRFQALRAFYDVTEMGPDRG